MANFCIECDNTQMAFQKEKSGSTRCMVWRGEMAVELHDLYQVADTRPLGFLNIAHGVTKTVAGLE